MERKKTLQKKKIELKMIKNKAFTLIELLAVIIILGILMIIAIPSVTTYIQNSRKSAYVDTAKEIISGTRIKVNEGKLNTYDTNVTYYIPVSCIKTESGLKTPYGEFENDGAYVGLIFNGKGYDYYWISNDTSGQGVKNVTSIDNLDENDIVSGIKANEIYNKVKSTGIEGREKIVIFDNECKNQEEYVAQNYVDLNGDPVITKKLATGEYVNYMGNLYITLYDENSEYGWTEIVSAKPLETVGFGKNDTSNGAKGSYGSLERTIWSYSNAIRILNDVAQKYLDPNLADRARCVGSVPDNPLSEALNNGQDNNYIKDTKQLRMINSLFDITSEGNNSYWLASRGDVGEVTINSSVGIRSLSSENQRKKFINYPNSYEYVKIVLTVCDGPSFYDRYEEFDMGGGNLNCNGYYNYVTSGFRPVIRLKSGVKIKSGSGTLNDPYELK